MNTERSDSVLSRLKALYHDHKWHDLEFLCADEETGGNKMFLAHRLVLASSSPVFEALCYGTMAEKGVVKVTDVDATTFDAMLQFIYTDAIQYSLSPALACNLLYVGKKYLIESLENLARDYLMVEIRDGNCFEIYNAAANLYETDLANTCFHHICRRMPHLKQYITNENLTKDIMQKLVTSAKINCPESTLAELAILYGKTACQEAGLEESVDNVRNILRQHNISQNIRWNLMTSEELSPFLAELKNHETVSTTLSLREKLTEKMVVVQRYCENENCRADRISNCDLTVVTNFQVNNAVMLAGIFINAKCEILFSKLLKPYYKEHMVINICDNKCNLVHVEDFISEVRFGSPFLVSFSKHIAIPENTRFTIRIKMPPKYFSYPFGVYNHFCKNPCGLTVECNEYADFSEVGKFRLAYDLTVVTGFQFLC